MDLKSFPKRLFDTFFSGGPASVYAKDAPLAPAYIYEKGLPVLGICYGMQRIAVDFGGSVIRSDHHEYGKAELEIVKPSPLFDDVDNGTTVWMSHSDRVDDLPEGFEPIAISANSPYAAIANEEKKVYAMQFHPEVNHSVEGYLMLRNFARKICGVTEKWEMGHFLKEQIKIIREKVGDGKVLCGLSGGVDSSVVAALLYEAIGDQLTCVFVDNGLLRHREGDQVMATFAEHMGVPRMVFINKLDKERASFDRTLAHLRERFGQGIAPLELPIGEIEHRRRHGVDVHDVQAGR